jgi:nitronate monooxygenase
VRTPVCELLGIERPIVQAPMASAANARLASAVSNAGALGLVALTWVSDVGSVVSDTAGLTDRPFGANFVLEWDMHRRVDQALEAGLRIVSLTWGDPDPYVAQVHDAGALLMHTVSSAEEARRAADAGVDVIVAQGWEAGGHVRGTVATLPLVPAVVDAVAPVPVIAAGGIGDARGVAAVLALGAQAAWVGTRFLLAEEAPVHAEYRRRLIAATETDAEWYANLYDVGWPNAPHRALRNSTSREWQLAGKPRSGARPGEGEAVAYLASGAPLVRYSSEMALEGTTGDVDALSLWAGQSVTLVKRVQPAAEIVAELVARV